MDKLVPELSLARRNVVVRAGLGPFRPADPAPPPAGLLSKGAEPESRRRPLSSWGFCSPDLTLLPNWGKQKSSLGAAGI